MFNGVVYEINGVRCWTVQVTSAIFIRLICYDSSVEAEVVSDESLNCQIQSNQVKL